MKKQKEIKLDHIITLEDVAKRDGDENGIAWLKRKSREAASLGKYEHAWNGEVSKGEAVLASINAGRWGARCKVCGTPQYVSPECAVLFCLECGGGAWRVAFPEERERIEAALMARTVVVFDERPARNMIELAMRVKPETRTLPRNWRWGVTVESLEAENEAGVEA